jgi:hypothetical protein
VCSRITRAWAWGHLKHLFDVTLSLIIAYFPMKSSHTAVRHEFWQVHQVHKVFATLPRSL